MTSSILIIDDSIEWRLLTRETLQLAGYRTYEANDGIEGLKLAKQHKPNLILCDIIMPKLDGYGVLLALETIPEITETPFIFMTSKAERHDFRNGMALGADDYLAKPFNSEELLQTISARLRKNELRKKVFEKGFKGLNDFINKTTKIQNETNILWENRTIKKVRKKDMLFMESDSANFLYFVISGKIKVFKSNELGKSYIISIHKEGDFIGYSTVLEDTKHRESAMAMENSEVVFISKQDFFQLLYADTKVAIKFVKLMSKDFSEVQERLLKLAYDSAKKRVAEALIYISRKYKTEADKEHSFTIDRENISALCGVSPESVSRNLTELKEEGLIETNNGSIKIVNFKNLERLRN